MVPATTVTLPRNLPTTNAVRDTGFDSSRKMVRLFHSEQTASDVRTMESSCVKMRPPMRPKPK